MKGTLHITIRRVSKCSICQLTVPHVPVAVPDCKKQAYIVKRLKLALISWIYVSFSQYYFLTIENMFGQQKISNHQNSHKAFQNEYSRRAFVEKPCSFTYGYFVFQGHQNTTLLYPRHTRKLFCDRSEVPLFSSTLARNCNRFMPSFLRSMYFVDTSNSICMYLNVVWWEYPWTNWQFLFQNIDNKKRCFLVNMYSKYCFFGIYKSIIHCCRLKLCFIIALVW